MRNQRNSGGILVVVLLVLIVLAFLWHETTCEDHGHFQVRNPEIEAMTTAFEEVE